MLSRTMRFAWVVACLILAGCGFSPLAGQSKGGQGLPHRSILGPQADGYVSTVAWPRGGVIFLGYVPPDPAPPPQGRRPNAHRSELPPVTPPDDPAGPPSSYQDLR